VALSGTVSGLAQARLQRQRDRRTFSRLYRNVAPRQLDGNDSSADAVTLANGTATVSAQVTDAHGNQSTLVTSRDGGRDATHGDDRADRRQQPHHASEAAAGVALSGRYRAGAGRDLQRQRDRRHVLQDLYATVARRQLDGNDPSADAVTLANGTATVSHR